MGEISKYKKTHNSSHQNTMSIITSSFIFFSPSPKDILFSTDFRGRKEGKEEERERERDTDERNIKGLPSIFALIGDGIQNLDMSPNQESNAPSFGV